MCLLVLMLPLALVGSAIHKLASEMEAECGWVVRGCKEDASFPVLLKWAIYDALLDFFGIEKPYP